METITMKKSNLQFLLLSLFFTMAVGFGAFEVTYNLAPGMNETLDVPYVALSAIASGVTATDTMYIDFNRDLILASFFQDNDNDTIIEDSSTYHQSGTAEIGDINYLTQGPSSSSIEILMGPIRYNHSYNLGYFWTVSFWTKLTETVDGVLIDSTQTNGAQTQGWRVFVDYIAGTTFNVKFQYWDVTGVMHQVVIPCEKGTWTFFTFVMKDGTQVDGYKNSAWVDDSSGDSFVPITSPIFVGAPINNASDVFVAYFDDFTIFKRALTVSQIEALEGNKKTDVAMSKTNLERNATYDAWAIAKKGAGDVWESDYVHFYTSVFGQPPQDNLAPTVILLGTPTGWTTCNSEEPYINFIISDDSPAQFTCTLYIDGLERGMLF